MTNLAITLIRATGGRAGSFGSSIFVSFDFDCHQRVSHEANIVNFVRDGFDDAIAGGWNLGDELVGEDLDEVIELHE